MYIEIEPARAKAAKEPPWDDGDFYAEEKLDGWRFLMHMDRRFPRTFMTGRRTSEITGFLSEKGECAKPLWPKFMPWDYTVLDGEVMPPEGAGFRDIAGIMNVAPEDAAKRIAEIGPPRYVAFDLLFWQGEDLRMEPQSRRRCMLLDVVEQLKNPLVMVTQTLYPTKEEFDRVVSLGGEGLILKKKHAPYDASGAWLKIKRTSTLDVVITRFTPAKFGRTGKFAGQIGAAVVAVVSGSGEWLEIGQVSGMDDATRLDMTNNPSKWIHTVIEIEAQEWAKSRLRHPRFKRHRPEADPKSATFDKMLRDLGIATAEPKSANPQGDLFG